MNEAKMQKQPEIHELNSELSQVNENTAKCLSAIQEKLMSLHYWEPEPEPKNGSMITESEPAMSAINSLKSNINYAKNNSYYLARILKHLEQIV